MQFTCMRNCVFHIQKSGRSNALQFDSMTVWRNKILGNWSITFNLYALQTALKGRDTIWSFLERSWQVTGSWCRHATKQIGVNLRGLFMHPPKIQIPKLANVWFRFLTAVIKFVPKVCWLIHKNWTCRVWVNDKNGFWFFEKIRCKNETRRWQTVGKMIRLTFRNWHCSKVHSKILTNAHLRPEKQFHRLQNDCKWFQLHLNCRFQTSNLRQHLQKHQKSMG